MKLVKKLLLGSAFGVLLFGGSMVVVNNVHAQDEALFDDKNTKNFGEFGSNEAVGDIALGGTEKDNSNKLIDIIKSFINWMLGILGLIALVILLVGGFQMVTAAGDEEKYKKGFTILKQAGIGLAFIFLAWFALSMIFRLLGKVSGEDTSGN